MSDQLPPLISYESLRVIAAAAKVGEVSADVLSFLSASAEYHLLDVVNEASNFCSQGKRSRLSTDDVNSALELRGSESLLFFSGGSSASRSSSKSKEDGSKKGIMASADSKVDLRKVANASLPVCPVEPGFDMHWLAVDGQQPLLPQNPIPGSAKGKGKTGKRGRGSGKGAGGGKDGSSMQATLSEELTTYFRRCCEATLSRDDKKRARALASLRNDPGLQQLLPHFCTFIQSKVIEFLKVQKDPDQLAALLQMLQCLLNNTHFAFLEIYLDRLMPPVLSCMLHSDFARKQHQEGTEAVAGPGAPKSGSSLRTANGGAAVVASTGEFKWTHWKVRDYAGELLHAICDKHGNTYPTVQARATDMFRRQVASAKTPLTTLYGAIKGLVALGALTVEHTISPRIEALASRIIRCRDEAGEEQNFVVVEYANRCLWALLQAAGTTTVSSCRSLVGSSPISAEGSHVTTTLMKAVVDVTLKAEDDGKRATTASNSNNGVTGSGRSGAGDDFVSGCSGSSGNLGFARGSRVSGDGGGVGASRHGDHRSRISRRVTRSHYPRPKPSTPERLERIKQATTALERVKSKKSPTGAFQNISEGHDADGYATKMGTGGAKTGHAVGAALVVPKTEVVVEAMDVEGRGFSRGPGLSGGVKRRRGSEWGLGELDEVVLPWYVMGLRREQYAVPQAQWLLDLHAAVL